MVPTTDLTGCTEKFGGTSASWCSSSPVLKHDQHFLLFVVVCCLLTEGAWRPVSPMAAGVVALVLQANQNLTWRDMQHLVVRTARRITPNHHDWQRNGAGRWFSHYYGYGLLVRPPTTTTTTLRHQPPTI
jgi:hypothetical protein